MARLGNVQRIPSDAFDATQAVGTVVSSVIDTEDYNNIQWQVEQVTGTVTTGLSIKIQGSVDGVTFTDMRTHGGGAAADVVGVTRSVGTLVTYGMINRSKFIRFAIHSTLTGTVTAKLHIHMSRI
jgi:hypothetical protein